MNYKKLLIQVALLVFFFALAYFISIAGKRGTYETHTGFAQGTTYRITYENNRGLQLQPAIDSLLSDFNTSLSIYDTLSVISRINRNDPLVKPDDKFIAIFSKSLEVNQKTEGAFDITVGPLVNAMGFGSSDTLEVDSAMIDSLLMFVGMEKVSLKDGVLRKQDPRMQLDVNAIAQGYAVDLVAAFLEEKRSKNYLVEIGGEVRARGKNSRNQVWRIGIDKPVEGNVLPGANLQAIVSLKNRSLATSGNYRKFYEKNGIKFVHTVNPKTGYPVISNLLSATVVAADCATADAYATAFMVFGFDRSVEFLRENAFLDACLIYTDEQGQFQVYITPGLSKYITD